MDPILISSYSILPAEEADIHSLAQTLTSSHISQAILAFFFPDWPRLDTLLPYMTARLAGKFSEPNSTFYKAVDDASGEILGLVCMTLETGEVVLDRKMMDMEGYELPAGFNWGFAGELVEGLKRLDEFMVGKRHYMMSSLAVDPKHHKKGLGKKLTERCHEIADKEGVPIFLTAFPGAHHLYLKWGYEDVDNFDLDLNAQGEPYRGFGVYRSWSMIRHPKKETIS